MNRNTASGDVQGLGRLSEDLLPSNLPLSILCMQACCLYAFQSWESDLSAKENIVQDAAGLLIASIQLHYKELDIVETTERTTGQKVPTLLLLSKLSLFSSFFEASMSTAKMQALWEEQKLFESGVSLGLAIIPIVLCVVPLHEKNYLVRFFLEKSGYYGGSHADSIKECPMLGSSSKSVRAFEKAAELDIYCALYESTRFRNENQEWNSFDLALYSATEIALLTGCQMFACRVIEQTKDILFLAKWYSNLFAGGHSGTLQLIVTSILDRMIDLNVDISPYIGYRTDIIQCLPWIAGAMMQHSYTSAEESGAMLAKKITLFPQIDVGKIAVWILELVQCIDIPLSVRDRTAHAMSSFASSPHRRKVSAVEIQGLTNGFIQDIFGQDKIADCPSVGNLIELHNKVAPTFWISHEAAQIVSILTEQKGIVFAMSKRSTSHSLCGGISHSYMSERGKYRVQALHHSYMWFEVVKECIVIIEGWFPR